MISAFNGKRKLEELVKMITPPAFLYACVCMKALVYSFMPVFISTTHCPTFDRQVSGKEMCQGKAKESPFHNHVYFHS